MRFKIQNSRLCDRDWVFNFEPSILNCFSARCAKKSPERAGKPNSVPRSPGAAIIPLRPRSPSGSSSRPGDGPRCGVGRAPTVSLFGLAPHGVYRAPFVAVGAVRSYRTVSPLPSGPERNPKAVCFLWHFPSRHRDRVLPGMLPVKEFGLSSPISRGDHVARSEPVLLYQHGHKGEVGISG